MEFIITFVKFYFCILLIKKRKMGRIYYIITNKNYIWIGCQITTVNDYGYEVFIRQSDLKLYKPFQIKSKRINDYLQKRCRYLEYRHQYKSLKVSKQLNEFILNMETKIIHKFPNKKIK